MLRFVLGRLLATIPILLGVSFIVFAAVQLAPGDVARTVLGYGATEERVMALRAELGLDQPIVVQYARWLWGLLQGDLGRSIALGVPVATVIMDKIGASLILMSASFALTVVFGLLIAAISGGAHRSAQDRTLVTICLILASLPPFWLGIILLYFFGLQWKMFPIAGMYNLASPGGLPDLLHHLVLPAVATAASSLAVVARVTRGAFVDTMSEGYVLAAQVRGLPQRRIVYTEALRNTLPTFVNIAGLQIGYLFGSAIFSEIIFNWPGVGQQLYTAIIARDFPVIQGCVVAIAAVFVFGNLIADIIVRLLDPRSRA
jgi:peptide/nickel transport system permease protein